MNQFLNEPFLSAIENAMIIRRAAPDGTNAFYGDPDLKAFFVKRAEKHRIADDIEHGCYWEPRDAYNDVPEYAEHMFGPDHEEYVKHRGCAIGCLSHADTRAHAVLSRMTGVPEAIYHLVDDLFESYQERCSADYGDQSDWDKRLPGDVIQAIPVGADLSGVPLRIITRLIHDESMTDNYGGHYLSTFREIIDNPYLLDEEKVEMILAERHSVEFDTTFWSLFTAHETALHIRAILLDELRTAPVKADPVTETPQLVSDLIKQVVPVTVAVLA